MAVSFKFNFMWYPMYVYVCMLVHAQSVCMWRSEGNFWGSGLNLDHQGYVAGAFTQ